MKSTSSTSSSSSDGKGKERTPRLTVSEPEDHRLSLASLTVSGGSQGNISRKSSKTSLKSSQSDGNYGTKEEIIASMIKDKMRELEADTELTTESLSLITPSSERQDQTSSSSIHITNHPLSDEQRLLNNDQNLDKTNKQHQDSSRAMINKLTITDQRPSSGKKRHSSTTTAQVEFELETLSSGDHDITSSKRSSGAFKSGEGSESDQQPQSLNNSTCSSTGAVSMARMVTPKGNISSKIPISSTRKYSRSHQRRFHRRFPTIDASELLIDWFNCALIADILLQGYLYISDNYFAFYSNIFGYKTQILIPVSDVVSVTKEKTAKIFPNAVGICTDESKYVFGSFISRESAFRLMQEVWRRTLYEVASVSCLDQLRQTQRQQDERMLLSGDKIKLQSTVSQDEDKVPESEEEESEESDESQSQDEKRALTTGSPVMLRSPVKCVSLESSLGPIIDQRHGVVKRMWNKMYGWGRKSSQVLFVRHQYPSSPPSQEATKKSLLTGITVALVLLFLSATILIFRANSVYTRLSYLTNDGYYSSQADVDGIVGRGIRTEAKTLLITNHVKKIASTLQEKLNEVVVLRQELDQLFKKPVVTTEESSFTSI